MLRQFFGLRKAETIWTDLPKHIAKIHSLSASRTYCTQPHARNDLSESEQESLGTGRDLAKLSLMVRRAREAIPEVAGEGALFPQVQVRMEEEIKEAAELIRQALEKSGETCTVDELADRINDDTVSIPREALNYKDLLRVEHLRDTFEDTLFRLGIMPPKDAWTDGSGKTFCRLQRREEKRKAALSEEKISDENIGQETPLVENHGSMVEHVPEHELSRRKAEMEAASHIKSILRGFDTALLEVSRVHKVGKGGTTFSMRALVVIGDREGTAGYGEGKSETVAHAVERACRDAKRNLLVIDRKHNRTIHHRVQGKYVKSKVSLWPAPPGCGISANNNFSAVFQLFGIKDVGAKLHGPRSLTNAVKALFNALSRVHTTETIAATRGLQLLSSDVERMATQNGVKSRSFQ